MEPREFINKDLNEGDKVRLTLENGQVLEGYFGGYKCYDGNCGWLGYKVFPIFYRAGKKGQCIRRSILENRSPHIGFLSIKDVERIVVPYRHIGYYNNAEDCYNLGVRGAKKVLQAWKNHEGDFHNVDNSDVHTDVVPDDDTHILEDGKYAVRFNFNRLKVSKTDIESGGEDCGYYIDIFERIEESAAA